MPPPKQTSNGTTNEPGPDGAQADLLPFSPAELVELRATLTTARHRQAIETSEQRLIVSPFALLPTFKAVVSALRTRLYHGVSPASAVIEDYPSGHIRGRRAYLEGTPSAGRLLMGLPLVGQVLANWIVDVEARIVVNDGHVLVAFRAATTLPQPVGQRLLAKELDGIRADFERLLPVVALGPVSVHEPIVGPGQPTPEAYTGVLRDYSRCAALDDLAALLEGEFPIGRYVWPAEAATGSVPLFLGAPRDATGTPTEHLIFRNVCITAPVGMGKTYSIFRPWAVAAAQASFSTLVFDAKGDLAQDLREPVFEAGNRVVIFSTSPEQPSVAWNFLDEVEIEPDGRLTSPRAVEAIVDALLPLEPGAEKDPFSSKLFRGWLGAFVQIAKFALGDEADPLTLYRLARDEAYLKEDLLPRIATRWGHVPDVAERLYLEVADLFAQFDWGYAAQLRGIANALYPFVREPIRRRTRARPDGGRFRMTDLDRRPTTLILSCPLQDLDAAKRIGSVATALLLAHIYQRRPPARGEVDARIPIVLLLDETRLLNANLAEFLAVGRGFKAGVVTCYQELDQIRDEATRREILTNSNTLIALGGVGPGSRKSISERLARATIQVTGTGSSIGEEAHRQANLTVSRQEVALVGEYEMRTLPGPKHVALVHIQDRTVPGSKPFLVDLTDNGVSISPTTACRRHANPA